MPQVIQDTVDVLISSLSVKGYTKSSESPELDLQIREIESIDIGMSERLYKARNARIDKVSAMRPGFAKTIEKVHIQGILKDLKLTIM